MKCSNCGIPLKGAYVLSDEVPLCFNCFEAKNNEIEKTCMNCKHANYSPVWYWYNHLNPYCQLGHGLCRIDHTCEDFTEIIYNQFRCGDCYNQKECKADDDTIVSNCSDFISKELKKVRDEIYD